MPQKHTPSVSSGDKPWCENEVSVMIAERTEYYSNRTDSVLGIFGYIRNQTFKRHRLVRNMRTITLHKKMNVKSWKKQTISKSISSARLQKTVS